MSSAHTTSKRPSATKRQNYVPRPQRPRQQKHEAEEKKEGKEKNKSNTTLPLKLLSTCVSVPHPKKVYKRGEDASFMTDKALGVFDGVGSWSRQNVDVGRYSKGLARIAEQTALREEKQKMSAKKILTEAVQKTKERGTSTAVIAVLNEYRLNVCNVGDGMTIIIRKNRVIYSTVVQQRSFNTPHQLGFHQRQDLRFAKVDDIDVQDGDVIIMASDGLWDNLRKSTITWLVAEHLRRWRAHTRTGKLTPSSLENASFFQNEEAKIAEEDNSFSKERLKALAFDIATRACRNANSEHVYSPFTENAHRMGRTWVRGGKLDDITVLVSLVRHSSSIYRSSYHTICRSSRLP